MKIKSLIVLFVLGSSIFTQDIEVIALSVEGSVYVKKAGKRFAETIKLDTRYAEGSQIKTNEDSSVELLLSDGSVVIVKDSMSWVVSSDFSSVAKRTNNKQGANLWDMTIGMLDKVNASAANSNIVGSIRVTGAEDDLKNVLLTDTDKLTLNEMLVSLENSNAFTKYKMSGFILSSYKQYISAEIEYKKALELAADDETYNQILDYLIVMLLEIDRPQMADNYMIMKK